MLTVVQPAPYSLSNRLVEAALNRASTAAVYMVYRKLEAFAGASQVQLKNKALCVLTGLSESTVTKALGVLQKLGVVVAQFPENGNRAERMLSVPSELSADTKTTLQAIIDKHVVVCVGNADLEPTEATVLVVGDLQCIEDPHVHSIEDPSGGIFNEPPFSKSSTESYSPKSNNPPISPLEKQEKEFPPSSLPSVQRCLEAGLTLEQVATALELASKLPGWNRRKGKMRYCSPEVVCSSPELVQRLLAGEAVPPVGATAPKAQQLAVHRVYTQWREAMRYGVEYELTEKEFGCINARLLEGFTEEQLARVASWIAPQPWYRGQNARNKAYDDPCSIWRSKDRVLQNLRSSTPAQRGRELAASTAPVVAERY